MNNTKWTEIFKEFYYGMECADDEKKGRYLYDGRLNRQMVIYTVIVRGLILVWKI